MKDKTYFAETDFRGKRTKFGIKFEDRARHVYVIGKTGMGKSTMLENMAVQDIQDGHGVAFIDPHGGTAEKLLDYVPEHRIKDVIYFAPFDLNNPISFNVMEDVGPEQRHLVVSGLMSAFKKLFGEESFSDRMQYILQNTLLALLEYPESTLLGVNRMLTDKAYRNKVVANVTDSSVKAYWTQEFANYTERFAAEATPAIQNKIGQFTSNPLIRNIIGQPKSSFDFRKVMDEQKILIINLSKGQIGEGNANLLGSMIITKIYLAAMSRANLSAAQIRLLPAFYFFVDEFQSFANESFANILSEARKYKLSLTIAHQYIEQMSEEVRAAVFGNVGTVVSFRVGPFDAEVFEKIFSPTFTKEDMVNLGFAQIYLTMMIDGVGSQPFSALTLPPIKEEARSWKPEIIESSRRLYARPKAAVEADIAEWVIQRPPGAAEAQPAPGGKRPAGRPEVRRDAPATASVVTVSKRHVEPEKVAKPAPRRPEPVAPATVSLKSLAQKAEGKEKSTGKHSADLKDVITAVQNELKSALPKADEVKVAETGDKVSSPSGVEKKEIPEAELKKMLEV